MRSYNEKLVLELIRAHGTLTKADATRATGLSPNAISMIFRALEQENLILRNEPIRGRIGQPSVPMSINPDAHFYVSMAIGRRVLELAIVDFLGKIRASKRIQITYPTPKAALDFFSANLNAILRSAKQKRSTISGMSIAIPSELWSWTTEFDAPIEEMIAWRDFDLKAEFGKLVPWEILVENDATAACRAEHLFGARSELRDWVYFFVGTFIGGGIVLNGSVFSGSKGNAAGFGPMRVPEKEGGDRLVDHASLVVLEHDLTASGKDALIIYDEATDWSTFEPYITNWTKRAARTLAHATVSALAVIDFEGVVIDGAFPQEIRDRIVEEYSRQMAIIDLQGVSIPEIDAGRIGRRARILGGAAALIAQKYMIGQNTLA